jgi:hypothetical protein
MDFFMDSNNVVNRLIDVYEQHGEILVAVDFDDTIYNTHGRNAQYSMVIELLQELKPYARFMCFTASRKSRFPFIKRYWEANNLRMDVEVNENLFDMAWESRKPYFNVILDDRCGLRQTYEDLCAFLKHVSGKDINRLPKFTITVSDLDEALKNNMEVYNYFNNWALKFNMDNDPDGDV